MDKIRQQVAIASRRLFIQAWLVWLNWSVLGCFAIAFVLLLLPKLIIWNGIPEHWVTYCWSFAGFLALLCASVIAWWKRPSDLNAAVEIDRRYSLSERCSSVLAIDMQARESAVGQALVRDAQHQLERIDLRDHFPVRPAPQWAWVALPLAACAALAWVPDAVSDQNAAVKTSKQDRVVAVKNATDPILKALQKKIEQSEADGDQESADAFKRLEGQVQKLQTGQDPDPKRVIADLNEIKKELQQKRETLGDSESFKESLEGLKDLDKGPGESMAKAMQEGDFGKAKDELAQLAAKMAEGKLDPEQTKQLQNQMQSLREAMKESREKRKDLIAEAKRELEDAEREGNTQRVAQLRKELEKLESSNRASQAMDKLEKQLVTLEKSLESGDKKAVADAMDSMQEQFEKLELDQKAADELESMIQEINDAKESSKCTECNGEGCEQCQGDSQSGSKSGKKSGSKPGEKSGSKSGSSGKKSKGGDGKKGASDGQDGEGQEGEGREGEGEGQEGQGEGEGEGEGEGNGQGKGDKATSKQGDKGGKSKGKGKGGGKGEGKGDGDGEGQGYGDRDEKETDYKEYDAQVRDQMKKGETVSGGESRGKNRKGLSREEVREAVRSSKPDAPDAIENIDLPKAARDQLREYFDSLRDGKPGAGAK